MVNNEMPRKYVVWGSDDSGCQDYYRNVTPCSVVVRYEGYWKQQVLLKRR